MTSELVALCIDANDPPRLARFWAGVLGWEMTNVRHDGAALRPSDDTGFPIRFTATRQERAEKNRMHFDLTSTSTADQQRTVARSLALGAQHIDVGQLPDETHIVLADPEGNEFCVIEPGNGFLADCGFLGALACDGSQQVGYFWAEALGWPLVWDRDQETAIRSPHGGPKISWGGELMMPTTAKNRLHFDLAPPVPGDQESEVARLLSLGATRLDSGHSDICQCHHDRVVLADPDGNEFCVLTSRRETAYVASW